MRARLVCLILPADVYADFSGRVLAVADGDTLTVVHNEAETRVRLNGIDAPEQNQPFGESSRAFTTALVLGKTVTIHEHAEDNYGRTIGDVILPDGRTLNQELLRAGMAWWYHEHSTDRALGRLEIEARAAKKGLWADRDAIPPWAFRHQRRLKLVPLPMQGESPRVGAIAPGLSEHQAIVGNRRSGLYHRPTAPTTTAYLVKTAPRLRVLRRPKRQTTGSHGIAHNSEQVPRGEHNGQHTTSECAGGWTASARRKEPRVL